MHRTYHRKIHLVAGEGHARGELADDVHHFRVRIEHDGARVTEIAGEPIRHPWSTCPASTGPLAAVRGMALSTDASAIGAHTSPRANCTHMFDLAGFVIAHAASGRRERLYHCVVDGAPDEPARATLHRDGTLLFDLLVRDEQGSPHLYGSAPFEGVSIYGGFMAWARQHLDPEAAEAAIVLRRGIMISGVRHADLATLSQTVEDEVIRGQCYTYSEGVAEHALRTVGTRLDFGPPGGKGHERMLGDEAPA